MDIYSSGEDVFIKTRKPYTITKQREKWTEEEHSRFLEALKLYGRAWQRIEEHIGTKTAVQIRSHAQKFFSKLEKEALTKGIPLGLAHGIEIPPPRPKRKPNNPYPRKTFNSVVPSSGEGKNHKPLTSGSSLCSKKKVFDTEVDSPREDAPCTFIPPASKGSADAYVFREFVPLVMENKEKTLDDEYSSAVKGKEETDNADAANLDINRFDGRSIDTQMKLAQESSLGLQQPQNLGTQPRNELQGNKSDPEHITVYLMDEQSLQSAQTTCSCATGLTSLSNQAGSHAMCNEDTTPISATAEHHTSTSMSSVHQSFAAFPPFTQFCSGQDAYRSFLNMSSTFSSLIVSNLLQNPAAHAAAGLAASFWPSADVETSTGSTSETFVGGIPVRLDSSPSMAAIVAATVAAASAWWATHGLLPFCHPAFHSGFAFAPAPASAIPRMEIPQVVEDNTHGNDEVTENPVRMQQTSGPEFSAPGTLQPSPLSSSDSEESGRGGKPHNTKPKGPTETPVNPTPVSGPGGSDEARSKKKVDRSSCGSNTPSSSEVETDTILENLDKGKEETNEAHLGHPPSGDTNNRRLRAGSNVGESWKEVSQEGRAAFQALFSRGVLPQSFSPPHAKDEMMEKAKEEKGAAALAVDLNSKVFAAIDKEEKGSNMDQGLLVLTNEIGLGKLKSRRTGFKPYKRCSMEAKESRASTLEAKDNKRIRLEGEASTSL